MKPLQILQYLYQYFYYWQIEWDQYSWGGKLPKSISRSKALVVFYGVDLCVVLSVFMILARIIGFDINKIFHVPKLWFVLCTLAIMFINDWLLLSPKRVEYYREIFNGWDKRKRLQWTFYVIFIVVLTVAGFFHLAWEIRLQK